MEEQMLFFPLMTDGTLVLAEITFQAFLEISVLLQYNFVLSSEILGLCATALLVLILVLLLVLILLLPLLLPRINNPAPLYFHRWPDFFRAIKVLKVVVPVVLRGITFIPDLLWLLTLSRIRGRWGRWWCRAHAHVHPGLHQSHSHSPPSFLWIFFCRFHAEAGQKFFEI